MNGELTDLEKGIRGIDLEYIIPLEKKHGELIAERDQARLKRLKKDSPTNIYDDGYCTGKVSGVELCLKLLNEGRLLV